MFVATFPVAPSSTATGCEACSFYKAVAHYALLDDGCTLHSCTLLLLAYSRDVELALLAVCDSEQDAGSSSSAQQERQQQQGKVAMHCSMS